MLMLKKRNIIRLLQKAKKILFFQQHLVPVLILLKIKKYKLKHPNAHKWRLALTEIAEEDEDTEIKRLNAVQQILRQHIGAPIHPPPLGDAKQTVCPGDFKLYYADFFFGSADFSYFLTAPGIHRPDLELCFFNTRSLLENCSLYNFCIEL